MFSSVHLAGAGRFARTPAIRTDPFNGSIQPVWKLNSLSLNPFGNRWLRIFLICVHQVRVLHSRKYHLIPNNREFSNDVLLKQIVVDTRGMQFHFLVGNDAKCSRHKIDVHSAGSFCWYFPGFPYKCNSLLFQSDF